MGGDTRLELFFAILTAGALGLAGCNAVDNSRGLLGPAPVGDGGLVDTGALPPPPPPDGGVRDSGNPPPPPPPPPGLDDGAACNIDVECEGGLCLQPPEFPGGYCTQRPCRNDQECTRPDGWCVRPQPGDVPICATKCENANCRPGYTCQVRRNRMACLPDNGPLPSDLEDGEPCMNDGQCRGDTCLQEPEYPGGHCTTRGCDRGRACADHLGAVLDCVEIFDGQGPPEGICLRQCTSIDDCREDYVCMEQRTGPSVCVPDVAEPFQPPPDTLAGLNVQCGLRATNRRVNIPYVIAPGSRSYTLTAFARDGRFVVPSSLQGPGAPFDFGGVNDFQVITTSLHGFISPLVVPAVTQLESQLAPGPHTITYETNSQDVCWYLTEEQTPGAQLDLNIFLVGVPGINARNAPRNPDLRAVLQGLDDRLRPIGLSVGEVRYFDPSPRDTARFSTLGSMEDFLELMSRSSNPGASRDELMSLNLFFVETITFGAAGVASGIPGPHGIHGSPASGVVSTAELFGVTFMGPDGEVFDGNDMTASIVGHEIGHYLGLIHTSQGDGTFDPVLDTPECTMGPFPEGCPDLGNIMFPLADPRNRNFTEGQAYTLRAHALTKD